MRMPPHVSARNASGDEMVCQLRKTLYGLKQSAREWAHMLKDILIKMGCRQGSIDPCLYILTGDAKGEVAYVLVYVDDLVLAYSHDHLRDRLIKTLTKQLPIDDRGELEWVLKLHIQRDRRERTLVISQVHYVDRLLEKHSAWADVTRRYDSPMDERIELTREDCPKPGTPEHSDFSAKRTEYMTVVGSLLWLSACTRPDLSYAVSTLARFIGNPGPTHYKAMLRVLAYLNTTRTQVIRFAPMATEDHPISLYSDASWTSDNSVSGGCLLYLGCIIAWWTRRQKSVSSSSAEAEYFAAALAAREGTYLRDLCEDANVNISGPTPLLLDSKSAIDLTYDPVAFKKTKHILRAANELRDRVAREVFKPTYVEAAGQRADILTKPLGPTGHRSHLAFLLVDGENNS